MRVAQESRHQHPLGHAQPLGLGSDGTAFRTFADDHQPRMSWQSGKRPDECR